MNRSAKFFAAAFVTAVLCVAASPASAGLTRISGPNFVYNEIGTINRFDAAFDSANQAYLLVWGRSATVPAVGQLLNAAGVPIGAPFQLSDGSQQAGWARVIYSPEQGRFLVAYTKILAVGVHRRIIRTATFQSGGVSLGPEVVVDTWNGGSAEASGISYSRGRWIVTWWNYDANPPQTYVSIFDAPKVHAGDPSALLVWKRQITLPGDGETDPEIACDQARGRCLVVGQTWGVFAGAVPGTWATVISDDTGLPLKPLFYAHQGPIEKEPTVTYSAAGDKFIIAFSVNQDRILGITMDGGSLQPSLPYSIRHPANDPSAVGFGRPRLVYNAATQTTAIAVKPWLGTTGIMELDRVGAVMPETWQMTPLVTTNWDLGTQFIAPAADPVNSRFMVADQQAYRVVRATVWQAGGVAAPRSDLRMAVEAPASGSAVSGPLRIRGWAADVGATSGSGVNAVHVWAHPNPGSGAAPIFLGAATYGLARPDIGTALGSQFANSGYELTVPGLWPAAYDVVVYARSTISGQFSPHSAVRVSTGTFLSIDLPVGPFAGTYFPLTGWAVDATAATGTGVDTVHVWAFPNGHNSGTPPFFVGAATYGFSRPDVGAALGPRFQNSGYQLLVFGLSPGVTYDLVAYARSTATGLFSESRIRRVTVTTHISVDTPVPNTAVGTGFTIDGWAIDLAAPTGTGVDAVHVWAFKTDGAPAVFLGSAIYGQARSDVGAVFGARFTNSAYTLAVNARAPGTFLVPGTYDIVVFARSTVGGFNAARVIRVTVP